MADTNPVEDKPVDSTAKNLKAWEKLGVKVKAIPATPAPPPNVKVIQENVEPVKKHIVTADEMRLLAESAVDEEYLQDYFEKIIDRIKDVAESGEMDAGFSLDIKPASQKIIIEQLEMYGFRVSKIKHDSVTVYWSPDPWRYVKKTVFVLFVVGLIALLIISLSHLNNNKQNSSQSQQVEQSR